MTMGASPGGGRQRSARGIAGKRQIKWNRDTVKRLQQPGLVNSKEGWMTKSEMAKRPQSKHQFTSKTGKMGYLVKKGDRKVKRQKGGVEERPKSSVIDKKGNEKRLNYKKRHGTSVHKRHW
jgi:hypothetical protein